MLAFRTVTPYRAAKGPKLCYKAGRATEINGFIAWVSVLNFASTCKIFIFSQLLIYRFLILWLVGTVRGKSSSTFSHTKPCHCDAVTIDVVSFIISKLSLYEKLSHSRGIWAETVTQNILRMSSHIILFSTKLTSSILSLKLSQSIREKTEARRVSSSRPSSSHLPNLFCQHVYQCFYFDD